MLLTIVTKHFNQVWPAGTLEGTQGYDNMIKPVQYYAVQAPITANCVPVKIVL